MTEIALYFFPGACSRVTMTALEEIGVEFDAHLVNIVTGQQKSPEMLAINPKGKVPVLRIGDDVLTENAAILHYLHIQYPAAKLLPDADTIGLNAGLQDLIWCSSTLHPLARQIRMPIRFTASDGESVKANGMEGMSKVLDEASKRLEKSPWWYGDRRSIVDVYVWWAYATAENGGFDLSPWPVITAHAERVRELPAFKRMLAREAEVMERLSAAQAIAKAREGHPE